MTELCDPSKKENLGQRGIHCGQKLACPYPVLPYGHVRTGTFQCVAAGKPFLLHMYSDKGSSAT